MEYVAMFPVTGRDPIAEIAKQLPAEYLVHANEMAHFAQDGMIPERDISILVLRLLLRHFPHHHCVQREVNLTLQTWSETKGRPRVFCDIAIFWPWVSPEAPLEERIAAPIEIKLASSPFREIVVDLVRLTALSERLQLPSYFLLLGTSSSVDALLGNQLARVLRDSSKGSTVKRKGLLDLLSIPITREAAGNDDSEPTKYEKYIDAVKDFDSSVSFNIRRMHGGAFEGTRLVIWEVIPLSLQPPDRARFSFSISPVARDRTAKT